jgi:hypothetical protein
MSTAFSDQKITILRGNGFYYKFIPPNLGSPIIGDDDYIFTSLGTSNYVAIFVYFLRFKKTGVITGNMNIFTDNLVQFNVTVRKTRHFDNSLKLSAIVSGNTDATRNVTLNSGYVTIPNFPKGQPV